MRTVQEQLAHVLAMVHQVSPIDVVLTDAAGCILAADIVVSEDVPSRPLAACDGYAVRSDDVRGASPSNPATLPVAHVVNDATAEPFRIVEFQAIRVSAGVPLPVGADTVVPLHDTNRGDATVHVYQRPEPGQHVWSRGSDVAAGETALRAGTRLGARQIAFAASLGYQRIRVHPAPRVVIVPIGDELIQPGSNQPGVFDANGPSLRTAVRDVGGVAIQVAPVSDANSQLREALEDQLVRADLLITTGGLSEGENDTLKDVLSPLGKVRFDHVAMHPGMNQGCGELAVETFVRDEERRVPMYALPGHPAAAQIGFEVFVRPALRAMAGYTDVYRPSIAAISTTRWVSPPGIRQFLPVVVTGSPDEGYQFFPVGDPARAETLTMGALSQANALAVVPEDTREVTIGSPLHCLILDD
ncbi:molybdopterin molybdotransferase MoeA [Timonella sp. A28]|uniref:molybdopterin molybdotransferase MoeA n=1 Tax=Timonella sp. A28 TaxID=3442640 RepID=UPI003EC055A0